MVYNFYTDDITISKKELDRAFSDVKEFSILIDDITYLWLTEACGFTSKEARKLMNMGNNKKVKRGKQSE